MENKNYFATSRVNKLNLILIWVSSFILGLQAFIGEDAVEYGIQISKATAVASICASIIYLISKTRFISNKLIAVPLMMCPTYSVFYVLKHNDGAARLYFVFFACLVMISLYMKKEYILIYGIILDISLVIYYKLYPNFVIGQGAEVKEFISRMFLMNVAVIGLFFLAKWGNLMISNSKKNEEEAVKLLKKLEATFNDIDTNTNLLTDNINNCNSNIGKTKDISNRLTRNIEEISDGVEKEVESINTIVSLIKNSGENVYNVEKLSNRTLNTSHKASEIVDTNSSNMKNIKEQMISVDNAIGASVESVSDLQSKTDKILYLLEIIQNISSQTKLLSINATIESAKAGETGKGFVVIASEISKLVVQTRTATEDIQKIIIGITKTANTALSKVEEGNKAVKDENILLEKINLAFDTIKNSFESLDVDINDEAKMIDVIKNIFDDVIEKLDNIEKTSNIHLNTTLETKESIQEQDKKINELYDEIQNISSISNKLRKIIVID